MTALPKNTCIFGRVSLLIMFDSALLKESIKKSGFYTHGNEHAMSVSSTGRGYTRWPDVEAEIEEISKCPRPEWRRRVRQLHSETLVYLVRQIDRDDGPTAAALLMELSRCAIRTSTWAAQGFDPATTEFIARQIESKILQLAVSETRSKDWQFLEVSFATAVRRETWNLLEKYNNSPAGGRRADAALDMGPQDVDDKSGEIQRPRLQAIGEANGPEEFFRNFENEEIRVEIIENLYSRGEDPPCAEALLMVYGHGYSYAEAAQALGTTEWQIEYLSVKGKRTMREKLGVQI